MLRLPPRPLDASLVKLRRTTIACPVGRRLVPRLKRDDATGGFLDLEVINENLRRLLGENRLQKRSKKCPELAMDACFESDEVPVFDSSVLRLKEAEIRIYGLPVVLLFKHFFDACRGAIG